MEAFELENFFDYYVEPSQTSSIYRYSNDRPVGFYNSIALKREFAEIVPTKTDSALLIQAQQQPVYLPHQRFMQAFLSPVTPYKSVLAFHGVGTGKTILYVAITEFARTLKPSMKPTMVLLYKAKLKNEAIAKIIENQPKYQYVYDVEKDDLAVRNKAEETSTSYEVVRDNFIFDKSKALVQANYTFMTFYDAAQKIRRLKAAPEQLQDAFGDRLIVIDEAHHLFSDGSDESDVSEQLPSNAEATEKVKKVQKEALDKYLELKYMIRFVTGSKTLLLTATPMRDQPQEIVDLMNLVLPQDLLQSDITNLWNTEGNIEPVAATAFKRKIRGHVSYLLAENTVKRTNVGEVPDSLQREVVMVKMSNPQTETYMTALFNDATASTKVIYNASDEASMFIFPASDNTFTCGVQAERANLRLFNAEGDLIESSSLERTNSMIARVQLSDSMKQALSTDGYPSLSKLRKLSCKFAYVIEEILRNRGKKVFVYTARVQGGGALLFSAVCDLFGIRNVILTGATASTADTAKILKEYNRPENDDASLVQVVIGSSVISEGFDFKNIRKIFILTPFWNDATIDQAIGRGIRTTSHLRLPPEQRTVDVYRLAAVPNLTNLETIGDVGNLNERDLYSIDLYKYFISEVKDQRIKDVERLMKESAVDCSINLERNTLPSSFNNTRDCDYRSCEIVCDDVYPELYGTNPRTFIEDTWNLYFAGNVIVDIQEDLMQLFKLKSTYDFFELYMRLDRKYNTILLARALFDMITLNKPVMNRYGFVNYVRNQKNLYFLVDDPLVSHVLGSAWYAAHPLPRVSTQLAKPIEELYNEPVMLDRVFPKLAEIASTSTGDRFKEICAVLKAVDVPHMFIKLLRHAYLVNTFNLEVEDQSMLPVYSLLYDKFKGYFLLYNDAYVVDMYDNPPEDVQDYIPPPPKVLSFEDISNGQLDNWVENDEVTAYVDATFDSLTKNKLNMLLDNERNKARLYLISVDDPCRATFYKVKDVKLPRLILADSQYDPRANRDFIKLILDNKTSRFTAGKMCENLTKEEAIEIPFRLLLLSLSNQYDPPYVMNQAWIRPLMAGTPQKQRLSLVVDLLYKVFASSKAASLMPSQAKKILLYEKAKAFLADKSTRDIFDYMRKHYKPFKAISAADWREFSSLTQEEYYTAGAGNRRRPLRMADRLEILSTNYKVALPMRNLQFYDDHNPLGVPQYLKTYLLTTDEFMNEVMAKTLLTVDEQELFLVFLARILDISKTVLAKVRELVGSGDAKQAKLNVMKFLTTSQNPLVVNFVQAVNSGRYVPVYLHIMAYLSTANIDDICSGLREWLVKYGLVYPRTRGEIKFSE